VPGNEAAPRSVTRRGRLISNHTPGRQAAGGSIIAQGWQGAILSIACLLPGAPGRDPWEGLCAGAEAAQGRAAGGIAGFQAGTAGTQVPARTLGPRPDSGSPPGPWVPVRTLGPCPEPRSSTGPWVPAWTLGPCPDPGSPNPGSLPGPKVLNRTLGPHVDPASPPGPLVPAQTPGPFIH
jgi:hypothetical protein